MSTFYVYEHIRPDTGVVFYVGKGMRRRAYSKLNRNKHWHRIVFKNNGKFNVKIVNWFNSEKDALFSEKYYIENIRFLGNLVNKTDGGEGVSGLKHSEETKKILRQRSIEQFKDPVKREKHREATSRGSKGIPKSEEHKKKTSLARKGKPLSEEHRRKLSVSHMGNVGWFKGKKFTQEHRNKLSDAKKGTYAIGLSWYNTNIRYQFYWGA